MKLRVHIDMHRVLCMHRIGVVSAFMMFTAQHTLARTTGGIVVNGEKAPTPI